MKPYKKPYIILSAAMTIDGKIASKSGDPDISDEEDWKEVHKLRTQVDAIMVGSGTIIKDDPKLHIKFYEHKGYKRIVVDSKLSISTDSKVITYEPELYPTIICATDNAPDERIKEFKSKGVKIIKCGWGTMVDVFNLMPILYDMGIQTILLEGGGTLNWSFVKKNLVDEIRLTIGNWIVGGKEAITLVGGEGFNKMIQAPRYRLLEATHRDNYVILKYKKQD